MGRVAPCLYRGLSVNLDRTRPWLGWCMVFRCWGSLGKVWVLGPRCSLFFPCACLSWGCRASPGAGSPLCCHCPGHVPGHCGHRRHVLSGRYRNHPTSGRPCSGPSTYKWNSLQLEKCSHTTGMTQPLSLVKDAVGQVRYQFHYHPELRGLLGAE